MARYAHGHKRETKARILNAAMALFRSEGIEGVGVAAVMNAADLTHGGFYAHFPSKEALLCEGIAIAGEETASQHRAAAIGAPPGSGLGRIIARYLSRTHRDRPEAGCCIPALVSEISRHPAATRQAFTRRVRDMLTLLGEFSDTSEPDVTAIRVLATLVGSLELARAVSDPALSDKFLREGSRAASLLASDTHPKTSASAAT
jgi:TetR/AcrR family transcriptional repressor of nem operon